MIHHLTHNIIYCLSKSKYNKSNYSVGVVPTPQYSNQSFMHILLYYYLM